MKNKILLVLGAALIASGCIVTDTTTHSSQPPPSYSAVDEPFPVLNGYGNWIDVGIYGRVWQPAVMSDWRPYTYGQWVWTDRGWMWDSDEPFGWVVYHYGYWTQMPGLGWVWVPGNEWSPARVNWYSGNDYVGWAPMAPPHASYPDAYQSGYESYWTVVPVPQFTRLNVGAYRTTPPPPSRYAPPPPNRGRASDRPPDIITIQGATHQLISPRRTEQERVRVGQRSVDRVNVVQDQRPAPAAPVYVSPGNPAAPVNASPAPPEMPRSPNTQTPLPGGARTTPRPVTPAVIPPPPVQERAPSPVRVMPAPPPTRATPSPAPVTGTPAPTRVTPSPAPVTVAPAPARVTPAPAESRPAVPEKSRDPQGGKPAPKPDVKKDVR